MTTSLLITIIGTFLLLVILREIIALIVYGWKQDDGETLGEIRDYNRELYKSGRANRDEHRMTTIGWRRDPIHGNDGQTYDSNSPSGEDEYFRVVRKKK
jgi:hypothetical protein